MPRILPPRSRNRSHAAPCHLLPVLCPVPLLGPEELGSHGLAPALSCCFLSECECITQFPWGRWPPSPVHHMPAACQAWAVPPWLQDGQGSRARQSLSWGRVGAPLSPWAVGATCCPCCSHLLLPPPCAGDPADTDYTAVGCAVTTISSNLTEMSKGVKLLAALMEDEGGNGRQLLQAAKNLASAVSDLLKTAQPASAEVSVGQGREGEKRNRGEQRGGAPRADDVFALVPCSRDRTCCKRPAPWARQAGSCCSRLERATLILGSR